MRKTGELLGNTEPGDNVSGSIALLGVEDRETDPGASSFFENVAHSMGINWVLHANRTDPRAMRRAFNSFSSLQGQYQVPVHACVKKEHMNTEKTPGPAPTHTEIQPNPEKILGEATTGGQALILLGIEPPAAASFSSPLASVSGTRSPITLEKERLLRSATDGIPDDHRKRLRSASLNERDEFWKGTPEAERMEKWRINVNGFLE